MHGGVSGWESRRAGILADVCHPDRLGMLDEGTEQAPSPRQLTYRLDGGGIHSDVDELLEHSVGSDDPEGGVLRSGHVPGRFDDAAENGSEGEFRDYGLVGAQQGPQPRLHGQDVGGMLDQFGHQRFRPTAF